MFFIKNEKLHDNQLQCFDIKRLIFILKYNESKFYIFFWKFDALYVYCIKNLIITWNFNKYFNKNVSKQNCKNISQYFMLIIYVFFLNIIIYIIPSKKISILYFTGFWSFQRFLSFVRSCNWTVCKTFAVDFQSSSRLSEIYNTKISIL